MGTNFVNLEAPAKINLYLRITGRRADGYRLLATLMQKLELCDSIFMERCEQGVVLECPDSDLPVDEQNIAYRAAALFFATQTERLPSATGIRIVVQKKIPLAAGLGGGSSDAAAVLKGLNILFQTGCSRENLAALGVQLGADVPFFVYDWPAAWATGIGERLQFVESLRNVMVLLVNPGFPVSTRWVYENLPLTLKENILNLSDSNFENQGVEVENPFAKRPFEAGDAYNDLEVVTLKFFKEIKGIKEYLLASGAECALMSGSGPTVFALFSENRLQQAKDCFRRMRDKYLQTYLVAPTR